MFPIAFSIIRDKFSPEKLAIALGIFSSTLSGDAVIGLIIGGSIVESFGRVKKYVSLSAEDILTVIRR